MGTETCKCKLNIGCKSQCKKTEPINHDRFNVYSYNHDLIKEMFKENEIIRERMLFEYFDNKFEEIEKSLADKNESITDKNEFINLSVILIFLNVLLLILAFITYAHNI